MGRSVLPINHHHYQTSVVHLPSRYLESPSQTNCPSVTTSANVQKLCMHWQYSGRTVLQSVYRSVVVARLLYACSAWWGFTSKTKQLAGFVCRGVRQGFCAPDSINTDNLVSDMDDKLFYSIHKNNHHVLHKLLPPECSDCGYTLKPRRRNFHEEDSAGRTEFYLQTYLQRHLLKWF